jgi:hypothetical protein
MHFKKKSDKKIIIINHMIALKYIIICTNINTDKQIIKYIYDYVVCIDYRV